MCRLVADGGTALFAAVDDNKAALGVGERLYRAKNAAAIVGSVAGIYVNVKRTKANRAVIARGVAEGQNLLAAILAYKSGIVFLESFFFHFFVCNENVKWGMINNFIPSSHSHQFILFLFFRGIGTKLKVFGFAQNFNFYT